MRTVSCNPIKLRWDFSGERFLNESELFQSSDIGEEISNLFRGEMIDEPFGHEGGFCDFVLSHLGARDDLNGGAYGLDAEAVGAFSDE